MTNQGTPFRNKEETRQMGTPPLGEKARETASSMTDRGKEMASSVAHSCAGNGVERSAESQGVCIVCVPDGQRCSFPGRAQG